MPNTVIGSYLPAPSEVPVANILDARKAGQSCLAAWWPGLDTRPNSIFGDLHMTPLAVMQASLDVAMQRYLSDLDPNNLANGVVYNPAFAAAYLTNFGVMPRTSIPTTGVIVMTFSSDKSYVVNNNSQIMFGSRNFAFNLDEGSPIIIYPTGTKDQKRVLTRVGAGVYAVYFPISGAAGAFVAAGTAALTNIVIPELISIVAASDFDAGSQADSVQTMARRVKQTFYSATMTTRSGALSFLTRQYPDLIGASVTLTGDGEMLRDAVNPLGVHEGKLDIYVRSRVSYTAAQQTVVLTHDPDSDGWVGRLDLPVVPAFFDLNTGIFRVDNFNNSKSINTVYATSTDSTVDNVGVAYSKKEILGVVVKDQNPGDTQNQTIGAVTNLTGNHAALDVQGVYGGYYFDNQTERSVSIRFLSLQDYVLNSMVVSAVTASATDLISGDTITLLFIPNATSGATKGIAVVDTPYNTLFKGLQLMVTSNTNTFVAGDLLGTHLEFSYKGRTATFIVNYLYDPALVTVDDAATSSDNRPVGVDVLVRSFVPCHINKFVVHYRVPFGTSVDEGTAQQSIFTYLNSIVYPAVYEESAISQIMLQNGATGVSLIEKEGLFYPTLGNRFIKQDGTILDVPRLFTNNLLPPGNDNGVGSRNTGYLVDLSTIQFNATTF